MKKIELEDCVYEYALDEIDCFQKPIAIVLNSLGEIYSDIFILYSKTLELYTCYSLKEIRYRLLDILETMGLKVNKHNNVGLIKFICSEINDNNFVIVGLDYYNIFYSEYFNRESYPHWVIVNGYDKFSKVISIFDYTQLMKIYKYNDFNITYKMIKRSNKVYSRNYGTYDGCFSININNSNIDFLEQIKKLRYNIILWSF